MARNKDKPEAAKAEEPKPEPKPKAEPERIGTGRWLKALGVVFVIGLVLLTGAAGYVWLTFTGNGPAAKNGATETVILLEPGLSVSSIAKRLEDDGLISDRRIFRLGVTFTGNAKDLKAGEYAIPSGASMAEVMGIIVAGKSIMHKLTIPEGLTSAQIVRLIEANEILVGAKPAVPPEGSILPETYLFLRGTTRREILAEMREAHDRLLAELWEKRQQGLPFASKEEAMILASIVEKETGLPGERPLVAAVFVNRLRKQMRLQSDPTVIYGLTKGEPLGRGIRESELNRYTPYNTYRAYGLPPTPICNPGKASLEAVLNPPQSDYLYFVADGTGGHVFAATAAEHAKNVKAWREIEARRAKEAEEAGN